jgi:pimeloyl-ACP methyl ester carboxylesterase
MQGRQAFVASESGPFMLLMPFGVLLLWFTGLLSLGLLGGGAYLIWAWYEGVVAETGWLVAGVALVALTFLGRPLVLLLVGRRPALGEEEPAQNRNGAVQVQRLPGPDGNQIQVEVYGRTDGPTLVLTHGAGLNSTEWFYAKRHLADRFRLVVWDLPGLGHSTRPENNDFSLEKLARDLEAVVRFARADRPEPVLLLGHSIGGMILLTFCRLFPQHLGTAVAGLALVHSTYINPVHTARGGSLLTALQKPLLQPLLYLMIGLPPLIWLMNWFSYLNGMTHLNTHWSHFAGQETKGQLDFAARFSLYAPPTVAARLMLAMFRYDATETLGTIRVPVLVVVGDRDRMTLPEAGEHIGQAVPRGEIVRLAPAGHLGLVEQHENWANAVVPFAVTCFGAGALPEASLDLPQRRAAAAHP